MTDTTDAKAMQRPTRKHYDWSKAVWMDCDRCGEAHTGTVLADDGARICAGCCDAEYYSAWEDLAERAIKLLEAERQRAENLAVSFANERVRADKLAEHVEALKGEQVPVGVYNQHLFNIEGSAALFSIDKSVEAGFVSESGELTRNHAYLFTAPQKPVVCLKSGYLHKSEVIDAIEAAGCVVSFSDERLMQDMSGVVKDGK